MQKLSAAALGTLLSLFVSEAHAGTSGSERTNIQSDESANIWYNWQSANGRIHLACSGDERVRSRKKQNVDNIHPFVTITAILVDKVSEEWRPSFYDGMSRDEIGVFQNSIDFDVTISKIVIDCREMLKAAKGPASGPKIWRNGMIRSGKTPDFDVGDISVAANQVNIGSSFGLRAPGM